MESNKREKGLNILLWVQAFVFKLVFKSTDGNYKVEYSKVDVDVDDPEYRRLKILGNNRYEAFQAFDADDELRTEVSKKVNRMINDFQYERIWNDYKSNPAQYGKDFSFRDSDEWNIPEVKKQFQKEISIL